LKAYNLLSTTYLQISYWREVDERLIRQGTLIIDLDFVRSYHNKLKEVNSNKRGSLTGLPIAMSGSWLL